MKIKIRKTCTAVIDTAPERERIRKAFRDDPTTLAKLNRLMDAIESQNWKEADRQLRSKWWRGRDRQMECPRIEFVGAVFKTPVFGFDYHSSYADIVSSFMSFPENYKVLATKP
jgi:hypothetical protein